MTVAQLVELMAVDPPRYRRYLAHVRELRLMAWEADRAFQADAVHRAALRANRRYDRVLTDLADRCTGVLANRRGRGVQYGYANRFG